MAIFQYKLKPIRVNFGPQFRYLHNMKNMQINSRSSETLPVIICMVSKHVKNNYIFFFNFFTYNFVQNLDATLKFCHTYELCSFSNFQIVLDFTARYTDSNGQK